MVCRGFVRDAISHYRTADGYPPRQPSYSTELRTLNDATVPVLAAATGFFPSVYVGVGTGEKGVPANAVAVAIVVPDIATHHHHSLSHFTPKIIS